MVKKIQGYIDFCDDCQHVRYFEGLMLCKNLGRVLGKTRDKKFPIPSYCKLDDAVRTAPNARISLDYSAGYKAGHKDRKKTKTYPKGKGKPKKNPTFLEMMGA